MEAIYYQISMYLPSGTGLFILWDSATNWTVYLSKVVKL